MRKETLLAIGACLAGWLVYVAFVAGYRNGYEDGSALTWEQARGAFMPAAHSFAREGLVADASAQAETD